MGRGGIRESEEGEWLSGEEPARTASVNDMSGWVCTTLVPKVDRSDRMCVVGTGVVLEVLPTETRR